MSRTQTLLTMLLALVMAIVFALPAAYGETADDLSVIPANPLSATPASETSDADAPGVSVGAVSTGGVGLAGEEIQIADEQTQDWYDEMYARIANYVVPSGTVEGGSLRAPGQQTLSELEVEIQLALEGSQLGANDLVSEEGYLNIMLIGVDARPGQKTGRSDTMILCSVHLESSTIKLVSFMRDLYVQIPDLNATRMNTAYFKGGADLLRRTLEMNFGVTYTHYAAVNFSVLAQIIDQLGGLEIDITEQYFVDRVNAVIKNDNIVLGIREDDGLVQGPGLQTLTGKQAQAYARFRYGAKSGGDFGRTQRQREVIIKLFDKIKSMPITALISLARDNIDSVSTDLSLGDLISLVPTVLRLQNAQFKQLRIPEDGKFQSQTINGMSVLVPNSSEAARSVQSFLYGD